MIPNGRVQVPRGFTLLEVMSVVAILAVVLGIGLLSVDSQLPFYELERQAGDMALGLRDARNRAVVTGKIIRLEIFPDTHEFQYFYDDPDPLDEAWGVYEDPPPFFIKRWSDRVVLDRALVGRDEAFTAGNPVVLRFRPSGLCTPVRLYVCHRKASNLRRTIRLNPLTGRTTIVRGDEEPESWEPRVTTQRR